MLKKLRRRESEPRTDESKFSHKMLAKDPRAEFLPEQYFLRQLRQEQRRTERSRNPFVLLLVEAPDIFDPASDEERRAKLLSALTNSIRETDSVGWYAYGLTAGIIFTEVGTADRRSIGEKLLKKFEKLLDLVLGAVQARQVKLSFHIFPEDWSGGHSNRSGGSVLYPKLPVAGEPKEKSLAIKRVIDVVASASALIVGAPIFVAIALAVKLTSKGPVLFRQRRVGRYGNPFTFLKFRSMYVGNNQAVHQEYVKGLIRGGNGRGSVEDEANGVVYKLTDDPRVTAVGKFLRKTSLDELPQFLNVFLGDMSLVGPRPPIPYEVESYDVWHRRRLLEVKPGITGLWQVTGRSRTTFDDMVRLDLQYAITWSLWLDMKILLRTPGAVLAGDGAY